MASLSLDYTPIGKKAVADIACGEGYGSALLSKSAAHVTAVDIDDEVIANAKNKYNSCQNLTFQNASALKTNIQSESLDVVVSFETLEHLEEHDALLSEFKKILKSNGVLIISTPDKLVYSGDSHHNEFHLKELTSVEFNQLINKYFEHALFFGQDIQTMSCISPQKVSNNPTAELKYCQKNNEFEVVEKKCKPTYLIAIASDDEAELLPYKNISHSVFNDVDNELFSHYEKQISTLLSTDQQLINAKRKMNVMEHQLNQQRLIVSELQARLGL